MSGLVNNNPLRGNRVDPYWLEFRLETAGNGSDPDGLDPDYGDDVSISENHGNNTGEYILTFAESKKPYQASVWVFHEEDDADLEVTTTGYTRSSGQVKFRTYTNSSGSWSAADTDNKTIVIWMRCTRSSEGLG